MLQVVQQADGLTARCGCCGDIAARLRSLGPFQGLGDAPEEALSFVEQTGSIAACLGAQPAAGRPGRLSGRPVHQRTMLVSSSIISLLVVMTREAAE
jgi:hypothetical protein